ncbi:hypothetical protein T484DRAFT_1906322 [Baffinella frigidus]|nr:hypothetical protein T484DRAFT_1906322 [Cryptophyta sp. CCMP2293]
MAAMYSPPRSASLADGTLVKGQGATLKDVGGPPPKTGAKAHPVAPIDWRLANNEAAPTSPMQPCHAAAKLPAATPAGVKPLREYREEAFQALTENFIPQTGPFHKDIFAAWAYAKDCPNVSRWCRSYMGVAPALRMFQMKILSLPLSSSGAERNFSVLKKIWSKDRQAMQFENAEDRVYMYCNQRSNDRAMADLFDPAVFLHVASDKQAPFHASA